MSIAVMYHALRERPGDDDGADPHYTVDLPRFRQQLAACVRLGGGAVSAREWVAGRDGVVVTFDDGHASNYRLGFPALRAAGLRADFFVNPAQVGTPGFASWSELREMSDAGMSIQSHGLDHRTYLTALPPRRLRDELRRARLEIEDHLGCPVTLLAPPGGRAPAGLPRIAAEVGYTHVLGRPAAPAASPGTPRDPRSPGARAGARRAAAAAATPSGRCGDRGHATGSTSPPATSRAAPTRRRTRASRPGRG